MGLFIGIEALIHTFWIIQVLYAEIIIDHHRYARKTSLNIRCNQAATQTDHILLSSLIMAPLQKLDLQEADATNVRSR